MEERRTKIEMRNVKLETQNLATKLSVSRFQSRIWLRGLTVKRPQALVALGALLVGAALSSMLLNLYGDVWHKMTREFRAYGPNVVLAPVPTDRRSVAGAPSERLYDSGINLMDENVLDSLKTVRQSTGAWTATPVLYAVIEVNRGGQDFENAGRQSRQAEPVVAVGTDFTALRRLNPNWHFDGPEGGLKPGTCAIGAHLAARFHLGLRDSLDLGTAGVEDLSHRAVAAAPFPQNQHPSVSRVFSISNVISTGSPEDDQVFVSLQELQQITGLPGKISLVELNVPGEPAAIERIAGGLSRILPGVEAHAVGQIVYSQGQVLGTIRWVLVSLTVLILIIISLCVMATMTAIVLERRKDVAVMKSLGASDHLVMRLLLSEVAALGLLGGLAGFGVGVILARDLGSRLFGVTLSVAGWTFPFVCLSSILIAVLSTLFPVRMVRRISPAMALKGQ